MKYAKMYVLTYKVILHTFQHKARVIWSGTIAVAYLQIQKLNFEIHIYAIYYFCSSGLNYRRNVFYYRRNESEKSRTQRRLLQLYTEQVPNLKNLETADDSVHLEYVTAILKSL